MKKSIIVLVTLCLSLTGLPACEAIELRAETIPSISNVEGVVGPEEEEQIEVEFRSREELLLASFAETDAAKLEEIRRQIAEIDEKLKALGVKFAESTWTEEEANHFLYDPFMDDDGFGEVIKEAGFEVKRRGPTILFSGFNWYGEEYRVITDSSDLNCEKMALVVKSHGKEWKIVTLSEWRDPKNGMICIRDVPNPNGNVFGHIDENGRYIRYGLEQHRFFQGNNAIKAISSDELNEKLYPGVFSQIWQNGEYYIIHLMYYGTDQRMGLENIIPADLYKILAEMGCVEQAQ